MKIFKDRKGSASEFEGADPERAEIVSKMIQRVQSLPTQELYAWGHASIYGAGKYLLQAQDSGEPSDLEEASLAAEAISAICRELKNRHF